MHLSNILFLFDVPNGYRNQLNIWITKIEEMLCVCYDLILKINN